MWHEYYTATSTDEVVKLLAEKGERARIVAGATDLILELERGVRKGVDTLIDVTRIPALDLITLDEDNIIHLGPMVTHNHCAASSLIRERAFPLMRAAWEVGAPQIRNRATVAGNLITASPANDTITPLMALDASVTLLSTRGERTISLNEFYTGVRKTVLQADEMLVDISFPAMTFTQRGTFIKLALRRAQAISVINVALVLDLKADTVTSAAITLGAVAPTILHADEAEAYLMGKPLTEETIAQAAFLTMQAAKPIDDIRASADYRREMVRVCTARGLRQILNGQEQAGVPHEPILLWGKSNSEFKIQNSEFPKTPIVTTLNGKKVTFTSGHDKTLLRLLREEGGLTGTKEGCAEGECGACTILVDGRSVNSCLMFALDCEGRSLVTIEGLAADPLGARIEQAFVEAGAVQCGFCTPGMVVQAHNLLTAHPHPTREQIRRGIEGNLCRCTGYFKIVEAIERAAGAQE